MSPTQTMNSKMQSRQSPCGCPEQTPSNPCCCNLVCFDRPNYFCGHLLTDADLTLQQKYVMEKNKLYHRTIDGYGIVCGLKLTCDCDCKGNILIHDGYAIDDCGNDLVVCETTRFDVIAALNCKHLLLSDPPEDDCDPRRRQSRCDIKQCFYITICYDETESDYETPFQSSCTAGPKQCLPTRTHEGVRFDVTEHLPPKHSYIAGLEERMRECFEVNCNSPIGRIIKQHSEDLLRVFGRDSEELRRDPCELFCELRAYFLNHLKTNPDQFNCNLYDEVSCLCCPECDDQYDRRRIRDWEPRCLEELQEAFRKLLYYMQRYQYDCVFGDLVFSCQQPCEAHCLVLGTVEVLNGKLIRVCNTPRQYLWAPANLLQVLMYDILTAQLAPGRDPGDRVPCCPDYRNFDPFHFLTEFGFNPCGRAEAATSLPRAFSAMREALHQSFDFTNSMAVSSTIFDRVPPERLEEAAALFGISVSKEDLHATPLSNLNPWQAVQAHALLRRNDSLVAYQSEGETKRVLTDFIAGIAPDRSVGLAIESIVKSHYQTAQELDRLREEVEVLKQRLGGEESKKKSPRKGSNPGSEEEMP